MIHVENGIDREMITVTVLKTSVSKAPFGAAPEASLALDQIRRTVNARSLVVQSLVLQKVLIEEDLVENNPFVFEAGGSRSKVILIGSIKKIKAKVISKAVIPGLIVKVP